MIKKWREQQQHLPPPPATKGEGEGTSSDGSGGFWDRNSIDWEAISKGLHKMEGGEAREDGGVPPPALSPTACEILWKYLAYGQIVTEADLTLLPDTSLPRLSASARMDPLPVAVSQPSHTTVPGRLSVNYHVMCYVFLLTEYMH